MVTVTINDNQWVCSLASTPTELSIGLSNQPSLPPNQGMLFDLGVDHSRIDINMTEMLFPLDIVFINSNLTVVGVLHDVQPNDEAYFLASNSLGARYFMEVNAGEAASVTNGDEVIITGELASGNTFTMLIGCVMLVFIVAITTKSFKHIDIAHEEPLLLPEKTLT